MRPFTTSRITTVRLSPPRLPGGIKGFDQRPFVVSQIARIAQLAAVVTGAVLARPHLVTPCESQATTLESHPIHMIQVLSGQTLIGAVIRMGHWKCCARSNDCFDPATRKVVRSWIEQDINGWRLKAMFGRPPTWR